MNIELEEMTEKTLKSGETITIAKIKGGYDVDCWDKDGNNRWNRFYTDAVEAQTEYDRWK